ncbi:MAG: MATE family efflux transporter [Paludibacteraceae bacterium]|nr:MATE family efflux transporter [Paludibacteraceae bacterium]
MNRQILRLAIPSILANITIPLVGLVDTAIVGHISDAHAIGGIAIGTMLFDLLYWNFGFLRVGTSGMTAQAFGRGDREQCARLLAQSVGIALIGAALIWLLQWLFVTAALAIVPCSAEVASFARDYFFVRVWAAPATLSLMAIKGWFIGMQDTVSPMITDIVVNVVNMAVSYALAVYTPLGALGVAYGTVVAQFTGLLLSIVILMWKYRHVWLGVSFLRLLRDMRGMRQLISLNANLFVRSLCFMIVYVGFTSLSSLYGDTDLAVCSILMKLFMLFSYFVDGFAYAGEALVGKYIGAAKSPASRLSPLGTLVRLLFLWSLGVGVVFTVIFALWSMPMYRMMTSDVVVLGRLTDFTAWLIAMPIVSTLAFMWDGVYTGATAGKQIRNGMILAAIGFVLGYVATAHWWGVHALFVGYFLHLAARVIYLTAAWRPLVSKL